MPRRASRLARLASTAAWLALAAGIGAQESSSIALGEVTVTAARAAVPESETAPAVTVVTAEDIAARGAATVADAIAAVPGLSLNDKGPEGSQVAISLRGSTTNQVLVLIDGVRVNDALTGMADLSRIPAGDIERIEVMRGGASSLYGGDAVGGVINVITRRKAAPLALKAELGGYMPGARVSGFGFDKVQGSFDASTLLDSQSLELSWAPRLGEALLSVSAGARRAANAYSFLDSSGEKRERENSSLLGAEAKAGVELPFLEGELSASLGASYEDKGVPGSESSPSLYASESDFDARALVRYSAERFLSDYLTIDASLRADWSAVDYDDGVDHADPAQDQDARHRVATLGLEAVQQAYVSEGMNLVYGLSSSFAAARSDAVGTPSRVALGAFVEPAFAMGGLTLRPSVRYDFYSDFSAGDPLGGLSASLGAAYRIGGGDTLKLNVSRAFRVPSFNDLHWPAIAGAEGNPDLSPETAYEADFGYERRRAGFAYDAVAYVRYARDVILWQPDSGGIWRPSNYGAALYPGIEQELAVQVTPSFSISASHTFLYSFVLSGALDIWDDVRLPMTPTHSLKIVATGSLDRLSWSATAVYAGSRYLNTANIDFLPAYLTLDILARFKVSESLSVYSAVDNAFDERYEIVEGYPMPGARLRAGFEIKH